MLRLPARVVGGVAPARGASRCSRGRLQPPRAGKGDEPSPSERSYEDLFKEEIARRGLGGGSAASSRDDAEPIAGTRRNPFEPDDGPRSGTRGGRSGGGGGGGISGATSASGGARRRAATAAGGGGGDAGDSRADGQRERSIAMVNEGLEGLLPRAAQLFQLGASVFLAFVPFIVAISLLFAGVYSVFGDAFVHGGEAGRGLPAYIDAEALLAEPTVDPRVPYQ